MHVAITSANDFKCVIMKHTVNIQIFIVVTAEVFKISDFLKVVWSCRNVGNIFFVGFD